MTLELVDGTRQRVAARRAADARCVVRGLEQLLHPGHQALDEVQTVEHLGRCARQVMARPTWLPSAVWELVLLGAAQLHASDLHLQASASRGTLELRVEGQILPLLTVDAPAAARLLNRLKVMARLVSYRSDRPQEGRVELALGARSVSCRVTTAPGLGGEVASICLHDPRKASMPLSQLGFDGQTLQTLGRCLELQRGLILVAGAPSAGKSTTLFSLLRGVQRQRGSSSRFFSIEDPVEVDLDGVSQVQVDEARGNSYASLLRVVLRQDADVLAVGEIRDAETAGLVARASLRGHLVLSTIHAGSAGEALRRMHDLCPDPGLLQSTLRAVIHQRLVPRPHASGEALAGRRADGSATLVRPGLLEALQRGDTAAQLDRLCQEAG